MVIDAAAVMRQAAEHFDQAAVLAKRAEELPLPRFLFRGSAVQKIHQSYAAASAEAMRGVRALEPLGAPLEDARVGVRQLLDAVDPAIQTDISRMREYTAQTDVPGMLRINAERLRLRAELDALDPAVARQRVRDELDSILRVPNEQLTPAQEWRAGVIEGLPAHQRPELPPKVAPNYPLDESAVRGWHPRSESMTAMEWHNLRLDLGRRELAADPTVTRESLDAEVRAIVATPYEDVTPAMNERLSLIAGMGDELRPTIVDTPMPWPQHRLEHISSWRWMPATNQDARAKYDALRMATEHEQLLAANPGYTREAATDELMEILSLPDEQITAEQMRRTSWLLRLPERVRPDVGELPRVGHGLENLGIFGYHPAGNRASATAFDQLRVHLAAKIDPERAAAQLKARVDAGEPIDMRIVTALSKHGDLLDRAGITQDVLHRQAMLALRNAGVGGSHATESLSRNLELVRTRLAAGSLEDAATGPLRRDALDIAERNLDRMAGRRTDTFGRHPDYAEIGRLVSITELLDALGPAARSGADTAAAGAEHLTW